MTAPDSVELDAILSRARKAIPGCVAVGCIDTRLGLLLRVDVDQQEAQDQMDTVTAALGELFRASNAQAIEGVFRRIGDANADSAPQLQQVFALSGSYIYVYQSLPTAPALVLATVCGASANLGMVLARARATLGELQGLLAPEKAEPNALSGFRTAAIPG
jgi:hypothetical protein